MAEGFLEITGITPPESAVEGRWVTYTIHTLNSGDSDDFKIEVSGDFPFSYGFSLEAGLTYDLNFTFKMPNYDVNFIVNTYHWVEEVGWVWDTSSVWGILFPFMNIHSQPYKQ